MTMQYRTAAGRARNTAEKTAGFWTRGARTVTDLVPGPPRVDLVLAVERYFDLVQRTVDINRHLAVRCAEALGTLSGVVREKTESAGDLVREKAEAAGNVVREQAEKTERAALEQAEKAEQAEKELARQGPLGRARTGQTGSQEGPRTLPRPDQGRAQRAAGQTRATQDGQCRRAYRTPRRSRQQVMPQTLRMPAPTAVAALGRLRSGEAAGRAHDCLRQQITEPKSAGAADTHGRWAADAPFPLIGPGATGSARHVDDGLCLRRPGGHHRS